MSDISIQQFVTLIKIAEVSKKTGFEKSFIYNEMAAGRFPKNCLIGAKAVRWVSTEIDQWIEAQISSRNAGAKL